jgi:hypothetical protein
VAFWVVVVIITRSWFPVAVLPFEGRLFFDTGLNIMRGLPVDYVSRTPKSYVDRFEKISLWNGRDCPEAFVSDHHHCFKSYLLWPIIFLLQGSTNFTRN